MVKQAIEKKPLLSVGYDLHPFPWEKLGVNGPHRLTNQWPNVVEDGPFDVVLLYDVLDHVEGDPGDPVEVLRQVKSIMKPGGRAYIRCHPWCSRTATHLYKKINKAFMHLIFSEEELTALGYGNGLKCAKIIHPHATYKKWFNDVGLDLISENGIQENVEEIFTQNRAMNERIKANWKGVSIDPELAAGKSFPSFQLRLCFIDYSLRNS